MGATSEIATWTAKLLLEESTETDCEEHIPETYHLAQRPQPERDHVGQDGQPRGLVEDHVLERSGQVRVVDLETTGHLGGFGQYRHTPIESDHGEVHQHSQPCQPHPGPVAVQEHQDHQHEEGRKDHCQPDAFGPVCFGENRRTQLETERNREKPPGSELDLAEIGQTAAAQDRYGQSDKEDDGQP